MRTEQTILSEIEQEQKKIELLKIDRKAALKALKAVNYALRDYQRKLNYLSTELIELRKAQPNRR